jgi:heme/copper-type cytochrome/quinol oxidase subunit 2
VERTRSGPRPVRPSGTALFLGFVFITACGGETPAPEASDVAAAPVSGVPENLTPVPPPPDPDEPGVREVEPGRYVAVIIASNAGFEPPEIEVPVGAEITFRLLSRDQPHGYMIEGTPVAFDVFPEGWTEATHTFTEPGEYLVICHVYCGGGIHEAMRGKVIAVEG